MQHPDWTPGKPGEEPCNMLPHPVAECHEQERRERKRFGVAFRDLGCYGFASTTEHQSTFASHLLTVVKSFPGLLCRPEPSHVSILQSFDGLVLPGEMLLVLGRPGSGCSTFLKTLAGDTHGFQIHDRAIVRYNSTPYQEMHRSFKGECMYLAELDVHFPELTLDETLKFAATSRGAGRNHTKASNVISQEVASIFHLEGALKTKIGNAMIRGLSGGEKRRTSLAESFIGDAQLQCWDNSTRGLDSSTARQFIELLHASTKASQTTVAMTIYQASDAMYKDFDKVTLLYEGRQIFFGPIDSAVTYFTKLGFVKPSRATVPDFLTSLTNPAERIIQEGFEDRVPRSPDDFAGAWKQSPEARQLRNEIGEFNAIHASTDTVVTRKEPSRLRTGVYTLSIGQQIRTCTHRGFVRLRQNLDPIISAFFGHLVLGLVVGSVFYDLDESTASLDKRAILLFFALMNSAFSPAFEVLSMWAQRPIVEKQHRYAFYHPFTESIASMICDLPNKLIISILFHLPVYFMTNLRRSLSAFFTYWAFMFVTVLVMSSVFRTIGSLSRTIEQTSAPSATLIVLTIIYTGFVIPPNYMRPWLAWFRWVNPLAYTYESLMINEYNGRDFPCASTLPSGPGYPRPGSPGTVCSATGAKPGELDVYGSDYIRSKYGYTGSHLWRNFGILFAFMTVFSVIHLLSAEFIPSQRSKGEVLLFRRRQALKQCREIDVEKIHHDPFVHDVTVSNSKGFDALHKGQGQASSPPNTTHAQSTVLHWKGVSYEIKNHESKILNDINGWVKPGTLTALMGVTGAGKTSLLDVLSNRLTSGSITGEVYVDGTVRDASFSRQIGYVQQDDIHLPTATVREALQFSALLRQPRNKTRDEKLAHVDNVILMLEMEPYADAIIGVPGEGLNVEQRRRLSIGVELAAKPELLMFLDEPTSGLDSQTAWSICRLLRKLVDHGQIVLCTIHQPSAELFQMFDSLLLLGAGGSQLYFGPIGSDALDLVQYFEAQGAPRCPSGANPAEWVIDVTRDTKGLEGKQTWSFKWDNSERKGEVLRHLATLEGNVDQNSAPRGKGNKYAASTLQQLVIVTERIFQDYWRDPKYLYSKVALCFGISLVNGISFYNSPLDIQGLTNTLFSVFLVTQLFSSLGQQIIPRLVNGRSLFEARERRNMSYSWVVFIASNVIVELFWQTLVSVLVFAPWYFPTGMWRNGDAAFTTAQRGGATLVLIWLFCLWNGTLSQALAAGIEHAETAVQLSTLCFWLSLVFCGILVPPNELPGFWIFMYRVSPQTYLMNGLTTAGLSNTKVTCSSIESLHIDYLPPNESSCGEYLEAYAVAAKGYIMNPNATANCQYCPVSATNDLLGTFEMAKDNVWRNVGLVAVYVVFNICITFGFYRLARAPRKPEKH